jgi:hypothetical protein
MFVFVNTQDMFHTGSAGIGLGAFAASELDKVFSGYQPR